MHEEIHLASTGAIPGIPGSHGPGRYLIDWVERTITRIEDAITPDPAPAETPAAPANEASTEPAPSSEPGD